MSDYSEEFSFGRKKGHIFWSRKFSIVESQTQMGLALYNSLFRSDSLSKGCSFSTVSEGNIRDFIFSLNLFLAVTHSLSDSGPKTFLSESVGEYYFSDHCFNQVSHFHGN